MKNRLIIEKNKLSSLLESTESYPHQPETVKLIQTHISFIAVVPPYVYKIKKPVNLGFLDFTTLQKRYHFCQREVHLNRRLCEDIYEGVVPISSVDGKLILEDRSEIVEYAVKMKELDADGFMNHRLKDDKVKLHDLDRIIDLLSLFYLRQKSSPEIAECGYISHIRDFIEENFIQTERFVGDLITDYAFEAIREYNKQFFSRYASLLNRRRTEGHILDCHGDLRLEHIHLDPDKIRIFDCIEFNDRFRYIDVANDAAFLAMDLDFHGRRDLSKYFGRRMAESINDRDLLELLDFYKCYRAYVRAKVHSLKSVEPEVPQKQKNKSRSHARRLYQLSLEYGVTGSEPMVVIIMGRIGTGKSTVVEKLSESLGWSVISSDIVRKQLAGIPLTERPDESAREYIYSKKMTEKTYHTLMQSSLENTQQHKSSLIDATFGRRDRRDQLRDVLNANHVSYCFVELTASDETVKRRLLEREKKPHNISDARLQDFKTLDAHYQPPDALEITRHLIVDTDQPIEASVSEILNGVIQL